MKKSLAAVAILAVAGTASAASSVTLYGIVDAGVTHLSSPGKSVTGMTSGGDAPSMLGFKGVEDLGGGSSASFWLEGQLWNDDGNAANGFSFNRRSTVSLSGSWGEIRLGRDYVPTFWNIRLFDPFAFNGVAGAGNLSSPGAPSGVRANNSVGYFLPSGLGGFYGQAMYAFGEVAGNSGANRYVGGRVGYAQGPWNVAVAYSSVKNANADVELKTSNVGASYNFGVATVMGYYQHQSSSPTEPLTHKNAWSLGMTAPVGPGTIKAVYAQAKTVNDQKGSLIGLGYVYDLSKRTALYGQYGRVKNSGDGSSFSMPIFGLNSGGSAVPPGVNGAITGYTVGIRHVF